MQNAMQEQDKVVNELEDTLLKITEDLLASNERIDQLEERLSKQEYLRISWRWDF